MFFKEPHYGANAPQNMMYKEQNKIKNTILFQIVLYCIVLYCIVQGFVNSHRKRDGVHPLHSPHIDSTD